MSLKKPRFESHNYGDYNNEGGEGNSKKAQGQHSPALEKGPHIPGVHIPVIRGPEEKGHTPTLNEQVEAVLFQLHNTPEFPGEYNEVFSYEKYPQLHKRTGQLKEYDIPDNEDFDDPSRHPQVISGNVFRYRYKPDLDELVELAREVENAKNHIEDMVDGGRKDIIRAIRLFQGLEERGEGELAKQVAEAIDIAQEKQSSKNKLIELQIKLIDLEKQLNDLIPQVRVEVKKQEEFEADFSEVAPQLNEIMQRYLSLNGQDLRDKGVKTMRVVLPRWRSKNSKQLLILEIKAGAWKQLPGRTNPFHLTETRESISDAIDYLKHELVSVRPEKPSAGYMEMISDVVIDYDVLYI